MASSRRDFVFFLGIGGATVAALTAAGFLYRAADRGSFSDLQSGRPFESWRQWQQRRMGGVEGVALAGTLAASSFNTQPWLFRFLGNAIDLFFNQRSYTVFLDPFNREADMGLGACLENMIVAAEGLGRPPTISLFPDGGKEDHIARLTLGTGTPRETPRFLAIANRRTNRSAYERSRFPPEAVMAALNRTATGGPVRLSLFAADSQKGRLFAESTLLATQAALTDPAVLAEQFRWVRQTTDQVASTGDGISFVDSGLTDLQVRTAMALPDLTEKDYAQFLLDRTRNAYLPSSPLFGIITVENVRSPAHLIEAGRLLQRLHLEATAQGVALQALSAINWMADREEARGLGPHFLRRAEALAGDLGTMVVGFRLGYATRAARATARRPLPYVLLPGFGPHGPTDLPPPPTGPSGAPNPPIEGPVSNPPKH